MQVDNNTHIIMTDKVSVRSGDDVTYVGFQILPKNDRQGFWINASPFISVSMKETDSAENLRVLAVRGENHGEEVKTGYITVTLDDGQFQECRVDVMPEFSKPPRFVRTPEIIFKDGKAVLVYEFENMGGNIDESEISWYRVDAVDRSFFANISLVKQSNERDCRKIAVSKNSVPCREIRLTSADVGKHLKVNIKPKHCNSYKGQGLNVKSPIVCAGDVDSSLVMLNVQNVVEDNTYNFEKGYFTVRGNMTMGSAFKSRGRQGLITESMGCGIYYSHEDKIRDMSLVVLLEPECVNGNGFGGPRQYEEIYIKYDPESGNGYGLRIEGTAPDNGKVVFGLYHYKNGNGSLISDEYESEAFKPGCEINLEVRGEILNAFITYDDGEDFADIEIRANIKSNEFGGFGFKHMAETDNGCRVCLKYMEARYN